jgi:hypothetical protein
MISCPHCQKKPTSQQEKKASFALSDQCLKPHHLQHGSAYIKEKGRLPKFHSSVEKKAAQLVASYLEVMADADSDELDLSDSFFDFDASVSNPPEIITVHAIGKPEGVDLGRRGSPSNKSTYHVLQWEVDKDISAEEFQANLDATGDLFIWYRWMGDSWNWNCVTRPEFEQLRSVEG